MNDISSSNREALIGLLRRFCRGFGPRSVSATPEWVKPRRKDDTGLDCLELQHPTDLELAGVEDDSAGSAASGLEPSHQDILELEFLATHSAVARRIDFVVQEVAEDELRSDSTDMPLFRFRSVCVELQQGLHCLTSPFSRCATHWLLPRSARMPCVGVWWRKLCGG